MWEVADVTSRTRWDDGSFDVVLDKAMLDALLTSKLAASATTNGSNPISKACTHPDEATEAAPDTQAAISSNSAHVDEHPDHNSGSAWSDTSAGDLSAARAYLAEAHRLLIPGDSRTHPAVNAYALPCTSCTHVA